MKKQGINGHNHDTDCDLQDVRLSALYRQLPPDEPSAAIDNTIRAAARHAVNAGASNTGSGNVRRWWIYSGWLASAAMIVLCIGLIVQMQRQSPQQLQEARSSAPISLPISVAPEADASALVPAEANAVSAESKVINEEKNEEKIVTEDKEKSDTARAPNDYRQAMMNADAALARQRLSLLTRADSDSHTAQRLDRDILRQLQQSGATPDCRGRSNGNQQLLCNLLILKATNQPLPVDWRQQLDNAGLWQGDFAYRHTLLERLLSP